MRIEVSDKNTNNRRYFLQFAYNGTPYFGFQRQPKQISVEETVESALTTILRKEIKIVGAGRTDTGVHAKQMFAHFDYDRELPSDFMKRLNSLLGWSIAIQNFFPVNDDAHARFDALSRTYEYHITDSKNPFKKDLAWHVRHPLDLEKMNRACEILLQYEDFTSFAKLHTDNKTNICQLTKARWERKEDELVFTISANRFLRNMVRSIVGTMVDVGTGKIKPEDLHQIIRQKDRSIGGASVPACGLYLTEVVYDFLLK